MKLKNSRHCVLCKGTGKIEKTLGDGEPITIECECVETGKPVLRGTKDTHIFRARVDARRAKKKRADSQRKKNRHR